MELLAGTVSVTTTQDRGHDMEFHVERLLDRLIHVSQDAPEPIKMQALIYRDSMRGILLDGIRRAIRSDRTTLAALLTQHGMQDAASVILKG